jgi:hypothetical protein
MPGRVLRIVTEAQETLLQSISSTFCQLLLRAAILSPKSYKGKL